MPKSQFPNVQNNVQRRKPPMFENNAQDKTSLSKIFFKIYLFWLIGIYLELAISCLGYYLE